MDLSKINGIARNSNIRTVRPVDSNNTLDSSSDRTMNNVPRGGVRFRRDEEERNNLEPERNYRKINRQLFSDRNLEDTDIQVRIID